MPEQPPHEGLGNAAKPRRPSDCQDEECRIPSSDMETLRYSVEAFRQTAGFAHPFARAHIQWEATAMTQIKKQWVSSIHQQIRGQCKGCTETAASTRIFRSYNPGTPVRGLLHPYPPHPPTHPPTKKTKPKTKTSKGGKKKEE